MNNIKCALCLKEKKPKSNTHYLTDFMIRKTLNYDGGNKKDNGLHFNLSPDSPYMELSIQRSTPPDKIKKIINRELTEEEIEKSKERIASSINNKFCSDCEDKFGEFEETYLKAIHNKIEVKTDSEKYNLDDSEMKIFKLFFLLQAWRTHICEEGFNLDGKIAKELRELFNKNIDIIKLSDLNKYGIKVTYFSFKNDMAKTGSLVGFDMRNGIHIKMGQCKVDFNFFNKKSELIKLSKDYSENVLKTDCETNAKEKYKSIERKINRIGKEKYSEKWKKDYISCIILIITSKIINYSITEESYSKAINVFFEKLEEYGKPYDSIFQQQIINNYRKKQ